MADASRQDFGTPQVVATVATGPGSLDGSGHYQLTAVVSGVVDGLVHTYRFTSAGIDAEGRIEPAHSASDVTTILAFPMNPLKAVGIVVQPDSIGHASSTRERSYVRLVDLVFSQACAPLQTLFDALNSDIRTGNTVDLARFLRIVQHPVTGAGAGDPPIDLAAIRAVTVDLIDRVIELDFGVLGIGGVARGTTGLPRYWANLIQGDGTYDLALDADGQTDFNNGVTPHQTFIQLLGDSNGDGRVDAADTSFDVNGDGMVDATDTLSLIHI